MAGSAHLSAALALFALLFSRGNAQCYTVDLEPGSTPCQGASTSFTSAEECCQGDGTSYNDGTGCQLCYLIGYRQDTLTILEGQDDMLIVELLKPPSGVGTFFQIAFMIDNSANDDDVSVGGGVMPTGLLLTGTFGRDAPFVIRATTDQMAQEGDEVFTIPLSVTSQNPPVPVFVAGPATVTIEDATVVIVEVTEADYQRREGSEDFIQARISYDRDLVNPITIIFHPVTYDTYEAEVGSLPIGFPSREFEASDDDFNGNDITVTIPVDGPLRQVNVRIPFTDDEINEHPETFVGYITIESAVDRSTIQLGRTATQLIINDNDNIVIGFDMATYTFSEGGQNLALLIRKDSGVVSERTDIAATISLITTPSPSATEGTDFEIPLLDTRIDFNPAMGNTPEVVAVSIPLSIIDDQLPEGQESFSLRVAAADFVFSAPFLDTFATTEVFINDNDDVIAGFEMTEYDVDEDAGSVELCAIITVPDSGPLPSSFVLQASTRELTADENSDYIPLTQSPIDEFNDDNRRRCFDVSIREDDAFEDVEQFQVILSRRSGGQVVVEPDIAVVRIRDTDPITIGLEQTLYSVNEDDTNVEVCVEIKSGTVERTAAVTLETDDITAEAPSDYRVGVQRFEFVEDGLTRQCTVFQIVNDLILEDLESFRLTLTTADTRIILDPEEGMVVISDDDEVTVGFERSLYEVRENNNEVEVCAVIISGQIARDISVMFTTEDDSAVSPQDYTAQSTGLTFSAPSTRACVNIDIADDDIFELDETFFGRLTSSDSAVNIDPGRQQTTVQINDEDTLRIGFTDTAVTVPEGDTAQLCARVFSPGIIGRDVPIQFRTVDGSAEAATDYTATTRRLDFNADNTELCVDVTTTEDDIREEAEEEFSGTLTVIGNIPRLTVEPDEATVTVTDDDEIEAEIRFGAVSYTVIEGKQDEVEVEIIADFERQQPSNQRIDITLSTVDGSATGTRDYTRVISRQLQFTPSNDRTTVTIPIIDDSDIEDVETFFASLQIDSGLFPGVTLVDDRANVEIISDDVVIGFEETEFEVMESDSGVSLELALLEGTIAPELDDIIVTVSTADRTATGGADFLSIPGQRFTFTPQNTRFPFAIAIINDNEIEGTERFITTVTTDADDFPGVTLNPDEVVIDILDNDVVIGFDAEDYTVDEDAGTVELIVRVREGTIPAGVTRRVTLTTSDGTASSPGDYSSVFSRTLTFTRSNPSDSIIINIQDDRNIEDQLETFEATLSVNTAQNPGVTLSPDTAEVTIVDNDITIGFVEESIEVAERGEATLFVTIMDGTPQSGEVYVVTLTTSDGTADEDDDYEDLTRVLSFSSSRTRIDVPVEIVEDNDVEGTESFFASLTVPGSTTNINLDPNQAEIEIIDDDVVIGLDPSVYTVNEGESVAVIARVLEGEIVQNVVVMLSTDDGTATAPDDYQTLSDEPATFRPGNTQIPITVRTTNDDNVEEQEQFTVTLSVNTNAYPGVTIRSDTGTIDIVDADNIRIVFEESEYTVNEGDRRVEVCAVVEPEDALERQVEATLSTRDGTAQDDEDYTRQEVVLTFDEDTQRICRDIDVTDDDVTEEDEDFVVTLTTDDDQAETGPPDRAVVTIEDNDPARIGFEETMYSVNERDRQITVAVEILDGELSDDVRVRFTTEDGTATRSNPPDYTAVTRTLTFGPSTTRQTIPIPIRDDEVLENTESFFANLELLSTDLDVTVDPERTEIEIEDTPDVVEIGLELTSYTVDENDGPIEVCVEITSGELERSVEVELATSDDSAVSSGSDRDYRSTTMTFTFNPGTNTLCVDIPIDDDDDLEDDDRFRISLTTSDPDVTLDPSSGDVIIVNDDEVTVGFEEPSYSVNEDEGPVSVCVEVVDGGFQIPVVVTIDSSDGTATSPGDFTSVRSQDVTFRPGSTRECTDVSIRDDNVAEEEEDFDLRLTTEQDDVIANPDSTTVNIEDDEVIDIGFERTVVSVGEDDGTVQLCVIITNEVEIDRDAQVDILTQPGTAEAGVDYTSVRRTTLRFSETNVRRCVDVRIREDDLLEEEESFTATLDRPGDGVNIDPELATVSILDETEVTFGFERTSYSNLEGREEEICVVVQSPGALSKQVVVTVTSTDISAEAPEDYVAVSRELTFPAGDRRECFPVTLNTDDELEDVEQFRLELSTDEERVDFDPETTTVDIIDESEVTIGFEREIYSVNEGDRELEVCVIIVQGELDRDATVTLNTRFGTADGGGVDYNDVVNSNLVFNEDTTSICTRIPITDDRLDEDEEMFTVTLTTNDDDIRVAPNDAEIIITDDDDVTIGLERTSYTTEENDRRQEVCAVVIDTGVELRRSVQVVMSTRPGTARANVDYDPIVETLMFDRLTTRRCEDIPIIDDDILENDEQFTVTLTTSDDGVDLDPEEGTIVIEDTSEVVIGFERTTFTVDEDEGAVRVCARVLDGQVAKNVEVTFTSGDPGTARAGVDYADGSIALLFNSSMNEDCVDVGIVSDEIVEDPETFTVRIATTESRVTLQPNQGEVTITDDDSITPEFEVPNYSIPEDEGPLEVCVTIPVGQLERDQVVRLTTRAQTASANADYRPQSFQVTFLSGSTRVCTEIEIIDDTVPEPPETFIVEIPPGPGVNVTDPPPNTNVTIIDNDIVIGFEETQYSVDEGDGTVTLDVVVLQGVVSGTVRVRVSTEDRSATSPLDYRTPSPTTVVFTPGSTRQSVSIPIQDDDIDEPLENFIVSLTLQSAPDDSVEVEPDEAEVSIGDADRVRIGFEETEYSVNEGDGSVTVFVAVLGTTRPSDDVEVTLNTRDGSATSSAPRDYRSVVNQILTFSPTTSRIPVTVVIEDDDVIESLENFFATLTLFRSPPGSDVELNPTEAEISITDNEVAEPRFEPPSDVPENEGPAEVCVIIDQDLERNVEVTIRTNDREARSGQDYQDRTYVLTFAPGTTRLCREIPIINNPPVEPPETFIVLIPPGPGIDVPPPATITIIDDDVVIGFERTLYTVDENDGQVVVSVVVMEGDVTGNVLVELTTSPGSAQAPGDYVSVTQVLTFTPTISSREVSITINEDNIDEPVENFFPELTLQSSDGGDVQLSPDRTEVRIIDIAPAQIGFEQTVYSVDEEAGQVTVFVRLLSGELTSDVVIRLNTQDGSATSSDPSDYTAVVDRNLNFGPTNTRQSVTINIVNDDVAESLENFFASLTLGTEGANVLLSPDRSEIRINDNDDITPRFELPPGYTVPENNDTVEVCIRIPEGQLERDQVVALLARSQSAIVNLDFRPQSFEVTFLSGSTRVCTEIEIIDDRDPEPPETFIVEIPPEPGVDPPVPPTTTVTIIDNDVVIGFDRPLYRVEENDGEVVVDVVIIEGDVSDEVLVRISTRSGTAMAPVDYESVNQILTFSPDISRVSVPISIVLDDIDEPSETFFPEITLAFSGEDDVQLRPDETQVIISDIPEVVIGLERTEYSVDEDEGLLRICARVLSGSIETGRNIDIIFTSGDPGTATPLRDYGAGSVILAFNSSVLQSCVDVGITPDTIVEDPETFTVRINTTEPRVTLQPDRGVVTITDDDSITPEFEEPNYSVPEEDGPVEVCVTIPAGQLERDLVATFLANSQSATANLDYRPQSFEVTFLSGSTRVCTEIEIIDDRDPELPETFVVEIPPGPDVDPPDDPTTVTIEDNDVVIGFERTLYLTNETAGQVVVDVVVLEGQVTGTIVVRVATRDGSAQAPGDYNSVTRDLTFSPSDSRVQFSITINEDDIDEPVENFFSELSLISPGNEDVQVRPDETEVRIMSVGAVQIGFLETVYSVNEEAGTVTVQVGVISGSLTSDVNVQITSIDGSATSSAPVDYLFISRILTFGPDTSRVFEVPITIINDNIVESLENFFSTLSLRTPGANVVLDPDRAEIRIIDQDDPSPEFQFPSYTTPENESPVTVCVIIPSGQLEREVVGTLTPSGGGSATPDADYRIQAISVTFDPETTRQCVDASIIDDSDPENDETFGVDFRIPGEPTIQSTVTIIDDDELCPTLSAIPFGSVSITGRQPGGTATYRCNTGFELVGPATRLCQQVDPDTADWSGTEPTCRPLCDDLTDPPFGSVTITGRTIGSIATYTCDPGRTLEGSPTRTCTQLNPGQAEWSGTAPSCQRVTVRFARPSYTFTERGIVGAIEVIKEGVTSSPLEVLVIGGPSTQTNIERSADGINEVIIFGAGPSADNSITVQFDLTDDDVALEDVEQYFVSLSVPPGSGALVVQPERTQINVLDDDVVTLNFGTPEVSFNESEGIYRMCIVKDGVALQRITVRLTDTSGTAIRNQDYRSVPLRLISLGPNDDRTCFEGVIITDEICLEDEESFTLDIEEPSQAGVELGLDSTTINIIDDCVVTVNVVTPIVRVPEKDGEARVCARKDVETAQSVTSFLITSPGKAQDGADYVGGNYPVVFGQEANAIGCVRIGIVVDSEFEDVEDFVVDLTRGEQDNVVIGPDDTSTVLIDDLDAVANDTLIGDPLLTVPLPEQSLVAVNNINSASLCYEIHGRADTWFNILSDGCVSVNAHYFRFDDNFNFVDRIAIRAVDENGDCKNILIDLNGCSATVDGQLITQENNYCQQGVFVRPNQQRNRVRVSVPNCNETSSLVMWTVCQRNTFMDPFDMMQSFTVDMIKFVIARGSNLGASSHGIIGQFWNIPIDVALYSGPAADLEAGQRYTIQVSHPESDPRIFTGLLAPHTWENSRSNCFYVGNRQGGTIQEVEDPNDSVIEGRYMDYQTSGAFSTSFTFSHFDEDRCS